MSLHRAKYGEVGCDEVGRGALAGPVVAASVCLPRRYELSGLQDSKQVRPLLREKLSRSIREQASWAVGLASHQEIDQINILQASFLAMHRSLSSLGLVFRSILVDGKYFKPYKDVPYRCVVRGDSLYDVIAAASIVAKTYRDELMRKMSLEYPCFGWDQNKGYPTAFHRKALALYGPTPYHRKSFRSVVKR